ncbi:MAG TPA: hypothetical protein ENH87_10825 [Pricia antarctica]|uniref:BLUF domain-containing protein n=1 Tax=Pricia antarctica TaxID=641691 RepID=A0A831QQD7_9FLAO|nr:hypothetical protein [Pricia antarctica]
MFTLAYKSKTITNPSPEQMLDLLQTANKKSKRGITSCLLFFSGGFLQILEGGD